MPPRTRSRKAKKPVYHDSSSEDDEGCTCEDKKYEYKIQSNDLSLKQVETMRKELVKFGFYKPAVDKMEKWELVSTLRNIANSNSHLIRFNLIGYSHSLYINDNYMFNNDGDEEEDKLEEEEKDDTTELCFPTRNVIFPDFIKNYYQNAKMAEPAVGKKREVYDNLPEEYNTMLLNHGVLQSSIDQLSKDEIQTIVEDMKNNIDLEQIVSDYGLETNQRILVNDSQFRESSDCQNNTESTEETESNNEIEEDELEDHRDAQF